MLHFQRKLPKVTVITPTIDCGKSIDNAIRSVWKQTYNGPIQYIVVGDGVDVGRLNSIRGSAKGRGIELTALSVPHLDRTAPRSERIAKLRNIGVELSDGDIVAFLDDDNTYHPEHLRLCVEKLLKTPQAVAVHSWRRIWYADKKPWLEPFLPWHNDPILAHKNYLRAVDIGKVTPNDNIFRDSIKSTIDTNCWVMWRKTSKRFPWPTTYTLQDIKDELIEDMALTRVIRKSGELVVPTQTGTVNYMLPFSSDAPQAERLTRTARIREVQNSKTSTEAAALSNEISLSLATPSNSSSISAEG